MQWLFSSIPSYAYSSDFDFDGEVIEGLLTCLERMVPNVETRRTISVEMEMYREARGLFAFADAISNRIVLMPRKPLEFKVKLLIMCFILYLKDGLCFDEKKFTSFFSYL